MASAAAVASPRLFGETPVMRIVFPLIDSENAAATSAARVREPNSVEVAIVLVGAWVDLAVMMEFWERIAVT